MKLRNIVIGLLAGIFLLCVSFAAGFYFLISPMPFLFGCLLVAILLYGVGIERKRRAFLQPFWTRKCTGVLWKRRFPASRASEIREFLEIFVSTFGFPSNRKLFFSPQDKVLEVFEGINPDGMPDCLELEEFALAMQKKYKVDIAAFWKTDITLGELFSRTHAV